VIKITDITVFGKRKPEDPHALCHVFHNNQIENNSECFEGDLVRCQESRGLSFGGWPHRKSEKRQIRTLFTEIRGGGKKRKRKKSVSRRPSEHRGGASSQRGGQPKGKEETSLLGPNRYYYAIWERCTSTDEEGKLSWRKRKKKVKLSKERRVGGGGNYVYRFFGQKGGEMESLSGKA